MVATRNSEFADDLATRGYEYAFKPDRGDKNAADKGDDDRSIYEESDDGSKQKVNYIFNFCIPKEQSISSRKVAEYGDLYEILRQNVSIKPSIRDRITKWISKLYSNARGFEIGIFNHVLLSTLMKTQSAKWPNLT